MRGTRASTSRSGPTTSSSISTRPTSPTASRRRSRSHTSSASSSTSSSCPGWVKTSGADGIHVLAPIQRRATFEQTYDFAEAASRLLEERHPGKVTTEWLKRKRAGVLVDHRQNGWGKTIASVYSVRPKPGAPVSTPLHWDELTPGVRPRDFTMEVVLERVERHGDLFAPVLEEPRPLGAAARKLARLVT